MAMAWMPVFTNKTKISYSIVYVVAGVLLYGFIDVLPYANPVTENKFTLRITELVVIVSLMGTGLKIDEPFSIKSWRIPLRLVTVTMMLSIASMTAVGVFLLGLDLASAILIAAALAPTDPVLASDVQVGPPMEKHRDNTKFSLTAEAGMNDGMAFPFTWLAIYVAFQQDGTNANFNYWFFYDLIYKVVAGVIFGFLIGKAIAYILFKNERKENAFNPRDGFISICATFLTYGITEMLHGYGFIAVFVAALAIRNYELNHHYHKTLHSFAEQVERFLLAVVLLLFGGALTDVLLSGITWSVVLFALLAVFIIRPLAAFPVLMKSPLHLKEKFAISFYGIKGIGSFFYLSFGLSEANFTNDQQVWSVVSCVVLLSIIIHGLTATRVMDHLGNQFRTYDDTSQK